MATYMCRECGEVFDDDNCKTFDFNYYSDPRDIDLDGMPMCPRCESMDYDEVHECEVSTRMMCCVNAVRQRRQRWRTMHRGAGA